MSDQDIKKVEEIVKIWGDLQKNVDALSAHTCSLVDDLVAMKRQNEKMREAIRIFAFTSHSPESYQTALDALKATYMECAQGLSLLPQNKTENTDTKIDTGP